MNSLPSSLSMAEQDAIFGGNVSLTVDPSVLGEPDYYIYVNASELYPYVHASVQPLRLSVLVNDNNGTGRLGWLEWSGWWDWGS